MALNHRIFPYKKYLAYDWDVGNTPRFLIPWIGLKDIEMDYKQKLGSYAIIRDSTAHDPCMET